MYVYKHTYIYTYVYTYILGVVIYIALWVQAVEGRGAPPGAAAGGEAPSLSSG